MRNRLARLLHADCGQPVRVAIGGLGAAVVKSDDSMVQAAVMACGNLGQSPWIELRLTATVSVAVTAAGELKNP